ncbi:MAG: hypothetical protein CMF50_07365 [Legionellales bacterium]|nr:hypothetical protein [Legionellales bacterium]|tara:strand:- start:74838 stop:76562 length:1725 start_codon:yes stop_codon:yes gene_type:complete
MKSNLYKAIMLVGGVVLSTSAMANGLEDAVQQAITTNPNIMGAKAAEHAAQKEVQQAKGGYLPRVDMEAGIGKEQSDNPATRAAGQTKRTLTRQESAIVASQLLFDGGNVSNTVRQRKSDLSVRKFQINETQESLAFDAAEAYLNVKRNRELVAVAVSDVKAHQRTLEKVRKRLTAGAGRKSELELADGRLARSRSRLQLSRGRLADAYDTYFKVVGHSAPQQMTLPRLPHVPASLKEAQKIGIDHNPTIGATDSRLEASKAAVGVAKSAYYPTFRADLGATFQNDLDGVKGHNNDAEAMVRMTYNVFNGGSDMAGVDAAHARESEARHETANIRRDVTEDVALSWNNLQAAKRSIPYLKRHMDKSNKVLEAYGKQFQLGQRTLFDLLNAETEYFNAKSDYIDGLYDKRIGTYRLLASMGILTSTLYNHNHNIVAQRPANVKSNVHYPNASANQVNAMNFPQAAHTGAASFAKADSDSKTTLAKADNKTTATAAKSKDTKTAAKSKDTKTAAKSKDTKTAAKSKDTKTAAKADEKSTKVAANDSPGEIKTAKADEKKHFFGGLPNPFASKSDKA